MLGLRTLVYDVADLPAAQRWYSEVLGQKPYFDEPFYVGFSVHGYELGLNPVEKQAAGPGNATTYLGVDDVDAAIARVIDLGAKQKDPPTDVGGGIRVGAVTDPFGNVLGFIHNPHFAPALVTAEAEDLSPRTIHHEVTIQRPRAAVWKQWTTAEGLKFVVKEAQVALRPGGMYEWYFLLTNPPGQRGGEGCRILSFLPEKMLSFTWNAPPEMTRTRKQYTWVVVNFEDVSGGTKVTLDHLGWPSSGLANDPQWEETYRYFERAWGAVLKQLAEAQ